MKNENYITILGWMINELNLSGNELICYAIIYGFSQDEETEFKGSLNYLASMMNVTKENTRKVVGRLVEKGLLSKKEETISGVKFCRYSAITPHQRNMGGSNETVPGRHQNNAGGRHQNSAAYNNIYITKDNNIIVPQSETTPSKERKTLFANSCWANFDTLCAKLDSPELSGVDIGYYQQTVSDWSDSKNVKRTERGWLATIRQFMRSDKEKGKLKMIAEASAGFDIQAGLEYLNL